MIGIGIISWNRPEYFSQLVKSLEKNDLQETEFHLFQDGACCKFTGERFAKETDILRNVEIFKQAQFPKKYFHVRSENASVAINQFEAMQFLYNNYEKFIFLEDDIIVSPNFIVIMKKLLDQFEKDDEIACISPGFRLFCKEPEVKKNLDKLKIINGHFWAEACWAKKWQEVEREYMKYYNLVKKEPYRKRKHGLINKLFSDSGYPMPATSQDNGKDWAIRMAKMKRARLVVNRATGIGDYGIHSTPEKLAKGLDGHRKIFDFKQELKIKRFKL